MARKITVADLARWFWERAGKHGLSFENLMTAGWPLDEYDQPLEVACDGDFRIELPFAMVKLAIAEGWSAIDVLHAFVDSLDPSVLDRGKA